MHKVEQALGVQQHPRVNWVKVRVRVLLVTLLLVTLLLQLNAHQVRQISADQVIAVASALRPVHTAMKPLASVVTQLPTRTHRPARHTTTDPTLVQRVSRVNTLLLAPPRVYPVPLVNLLLLWGPHHAVTAPLVNTLVVATPRVPTAPLGQPLVQLVHNTCVATAPLVNTLLLAPPRVPTATLVNTLLLAPPRAHRGDVL